MCSKNSCGVVTRICSRQSYCGKQVVVHLEKSFLALGLFSSMKVVAGGSHALGYLGSPMPHAQPLLYFPADFYGFEIVMEQTSPSTAWFTDRPARSAGYEDTTNFVAVSMLCSCL